MTCCRGPASPMWLARRRSWRWLDKNPNFSEAHIRCGTGTTLCMGTGTLGNTKMAEECCRNNALHLKVILFYSVYTEARAQVLALEWAQRMQYFIDLAVMNHGRAGELSHAEKELQTFSRVCGARAQSGPSDAFSEICAGAPSALGWSSVCEAERFAILRFVRMRRSSKTSSSFAFFLRALLQNKKLHRQKANSQPI